MNLIICIMYALDAVCVVGLCSIIYSCSLSQFLFFLRLICISSCVPANVYVRIVWHRVFLCMSSCLCRSVSIQIPHTHRLNWVVTRLSLTCMLSVFMSLFHQEIGFTLIHSDGHNRSVTSLVVMRSLQKQNHHYSKYSDVGVFS